jgi:hypothetical protein
MAAFAVAPPTCTVSSVIAAPAAVAQGAGGNGLASAVTVTATLGAGCTTPPVMSFTPKTGTAVNVAMTATAGKWTASIPATGYDFNAGVQTVSVAPASGAATGTPTGTFTVTAWASPCAFQSTQAAAPQQNQLDSANKLNQDERVVLQPTQTAVCKNIVVEYPVGDGTTVQRAVVPEGQNITGIIPAHTEVFTKNQTVTVLVLDTTNGGRAQLWSTSFQTM